MANAIMKLVKVEISAVTGTLFFAGDSSDEVWAMPTSAEIAREMSSCVGRDIECTLYVVSTPEEKEHQRQWLLNYEKERAAKAGRERLTAEERTHVLDGETVNAVLDRRDP